MLKILDTYIFKKYITTFLFVVLVFTLIASIIDFSEKVEDFIEEDLEAGYILTHYYINWVPYIIGQIVSLYALIAVIFFTSRLAYNSEIISILNAGVSFKRILMPYLAAASLIAGIMLLGNHYLIPEANKVRLDFEHTYIWKHLDKGKTNDIHMFIAPGQKVFIHRYKKQDTTALNFRIENFKDNHLTSILKAKKATWLGPPNRWQLTDYEMRSFNGMNESIIVGKGEKIDTTFNIYPKDFVRYTNQNEMMTTNEMQNFINEERARGVGNTKKYEIEIHGRSSEPFSIIILTIIGVAVAARKVRGGMGFHLALGMGLGAAFIFLSKFSETIATNQSFPALLGVWIPNIIFSIVAIYLVFKAQK